MIATVIVALIAAFSAIVAPVVSQWLAQRGAYKLKSLEMFAAAKMDAYRDFLSAATDYLNDSSDANGYKLAMALDQAILFSSDDTNDCLREYYKQVTSIVDDNVVSLTFALAHTKAVTAMHNELNEYQKYHKRS